MDGTTRLAGTTYRAQLYAGATPGVLGPVGASMTFQNGTFAGYLGGSAGFSRQITNVANQAVFADTNLSGTMQFYRARLLD